MGTWDWDIASGQVRWSAELESIHGLEPGTFGGTLEAFRREVHPADLGRVERAIAAVIEAPGAEYNLEYRIVREDGACRWLEARGRVVVDSEGRPDPPGGRVPRLDRTQERRGSEGPSGQPARDAGAGRRRDCRSARPERRAGATLRTYRPNVRRLLRHVHCRWRA